MLSSQFLFIPTHPFLWCTAAFILGIISAYQNVSMLGLSITACLLMSILLGSWIKPHISFQNRLYIFLICLNFNFGMMRYNYIVRQQLIKQEKLSDGKFDCIGTIVDQTRSKKAFKESLTVAIHAIKRNNTLFPFYAHIQIQAISAPHFQVGDCIKMHNLIFKPTLNESFKSYLRKEGITARIFIPTLDATLIKRPYFSVARFLHATRTRIITSVTHKLSSTSSALINPLFFGQKTENRAYGTIKKHCSFWGIVHYLARSGLHVVLILAAWDLSLRYLALNFFIKQILLLFLIGIYHLLTLASISFIRALITFILYKVCILQSLPYKTIHLFCLTTYAVLLYNPAQLFFLDFQLSFGLTFALAWFNEVKIKRQRFYNIIEIK